MKIRQIKSCLFIGLFFIIGLGITPFVYGASVASPDIPKKGLLSPKKAQIIDDVSDYAVISDPNTKIETIIIQLPEAKDPFLFDLLASIRPEIKVIGIVPTLELANNIWKNIQNENLRDIEKRLYFFVIHPYRDITRWGRDAYIPLYNKKENLYAHVPALSLDAIELDNWFRPDRYVPKAIARIQLNDFNSRLVEQDELASWLIEGGAITSDDKFVYIGRNMLTISRGLHLGNYWYTEDFVIKAIQKITKRIPVVLPVYEVHSDRYHMPIGKTKFGKHTSLLADPIKALEILSQLTREEKEMALKTMRELTIGMKRVIRSDMPDHRVDKPEIIDKFSDEELKKILNVTPETIRKIKLSAEIIALNKTQKILEKNGMKVIRIPAVFGKFYINPKVGQKFSEIEKITFPMSLSYINIIQDCSDGNCTAIIPKFGIKKLDDYAHQQIYEIGKFKNVIQATSFVEAIGNGGPRCRVQIFGKESN